MQNRTTYIFALAAASAVALGATARIATAQGADIIRGRVMTSDGRPVERAVISVTSVSGNLTRPGTTDAAGRFTATFANGDGDYWVSVGAIGFSPRRVEVKRTAEQDVLIVEITLSAIGTALDPVHVHGQRTRPGLDSASLDISGSESRVNQSALTIDQMSDLVSMAATLPGVQFLPGANGAPDQFSVLGLSGDQNTTTLNGMPFGGTSLPRDAAVQVSVATSPYDVSRGGFSGAQLGIRSRPGTNLKLRASSFTLDTPQAQWIDPAAQQLGQRYTNLSAGGIAAGPIQYDNAFYSIAYQLNQRSNPVRSLLNTDPLGLQAAGLAPDSAARLLSLLSADGIPATLGRVPGNRISDQGLVFGTLDYAPPRSPNSTSYNLSFAGSWNQQSAVGLSSTSVPGYGGDRSGLNGGIQARHTGYVGVILSETQVALGATRNSGNPYLDLPSATVRVTSTLADGTSSVAPVSFGGNPLLSSFQQSELEAVTNQLSWLSIDNRHRLKLTTELRHERVVANYGSNLLGTFSYNSLADFSANQPASFSRELTAPGHSAGEYVGALSLGDSYRPADDLQVQYGLRLDGNRFDAIPGENLDVMRTFGVNNAHAPDAFYLSPRFGFSYTYGTARMIAASDGDARIPRAVIRGGVGVFQNVPQAGSIGSALDATGLPSGTQQLLCVGAATPTPDWTAYAANPSAAPTQCANGSAGTPFANSAPSVYLFGPHYVAPRSARGNLQWTGGVFDGRLSVMVDATWSSNLNQAGIVDLNFNPIARFALVNEGSRPVYANVSSIVPGTGALANRDALMTPNYSRVTELRSDLRSEARQLTLSISPAKVNPSVSWSLAYVYSNIRDEQRGFSNTAGNPLDVQWGRSSLDSRHQIVYSLGYNLADIIRVTWYGSLRSGSPYTPMVAGDVNGDGYLNDRAFVFNPATTGDQSLANGMAELLRTSSASARRCLQSQLGQIAARNSCDGPWTTSSVLTMTLNPVKLWRNQRVNVLFQLANPLGAADLALHGENRLQGWGQSNAPSAALYYVRGFDPMAQRFTYEINPRFGSNSLSQTTARTPVALTAIFRVDFGPTREHQVLLQQLDRGRGSTGQKLPEASFKAIYGTAGLVNPMAVMLRSADSLQLTAVQADSLVSMNRWYSVRLDSIWTPAARYFAALPAGYDRNEAYARYKASREASVDLLVTIAPALRNLLTASQRRALPSLVAAYLDTRFLATIRSGTAGIGLAFLPGATAPVAGGAGASAVRGGNPE
jgi:hypothetical protein